MAGSSPGSDAYRDALLATARPRRLLAARRALGDELERRDLGDDRLLPGPLRPRPARACSARSEHRGELRRRERRARDARQRARRERDDRGLVPLARRDDRASRQHRMGRRGLDARLRQRRAILAYRLGGQGFNTGLPIGTVRDGEWHHIVRDEERRRRGPLRRRRGRPLGSADRRRLAARGGSVARDAERDERGVLRRRGGRDRALHARAERRRGRSATTTWRGLADDPRPLPPDSPPPGGGAARWRHRSGRRRAWPAGIRVPTPTPPHRHGARAARQP